MRRKLLVPATLLALTVLPLSACGSGSSDGGSTQAKTTATKQDAKPKIPTCDEIEKLTSIQPVMAAQAGDTYTSTSGLPYTDRYAGYDMNAKSDEEHCAVSTEKDAEGQSYDLEVWLYSHDPGDAYEAKSLTTGTFNVVPTGTSDVWDQVVDTDPFFTDPSGSSSTVYFHATTAMPSPADPGKVVTMECTEDLGSVRWLSQQSLEDFLPQTNCAKILAELEPDKF